MSVKSKMFREYLQKSTSLVLFFKVGAFLEEL